MTTNQIEEIKEASLGQRLEADREAEVFEWQAGWVIKLFYQRTVEKINYEFRINKLIHKTGLAVPIAKGIVECHNRLGMVFEQLSGRSMLNDLSQRPWRLLKQARNLAIMHSIIHRNSVLSLPDQRYLYMERIKEVNILSEQIKDHALDMVNAFPEINYLCHGDYHPGNVIATPSGIKVIDWTRATTGNPVADVALTSLILILGDVRQGIPRITQWMVNIGRILFQRVYTYHYFKLNPKYKGDFERWLFPIAIVRLSHSIEGEQEKLLTLIEKLNRKHSK